MCVCGGCWVGSFHCSWLFSSHKEKKAIAMSEVPRETLEVKHGEGRQRELAFISAYPLRDKPCDLLYDLVFT